MTTSLIFALLALLLNCTCATHIHPLDPLSLAEIQQCSQIIQKSQATSTGWNFIWITLIEPEKKVLFPLLLRNEGAGGFERVPRRCLAVIIERKTGRVFEGRVNLNSGRVEGWAYQQPGTQPLYAPDEIAAADRIFRNDSGVTERCAKLGYTNMENVAAEPWAIGYIEDRPEWAGRRLLQVFPYGLNYPGDNQFVHPFDFIGIVDVVEERVIQIEDLPVHHQFYAKKGNLGVTVPRKEANYDLSVPRGNFSRTPAGRIYQSAPISQQGRGQPRFTQQPRQQQPAYTPVYAPLPQATHFSPAYQFPPIQQPFYRFKREARQREPTISLQGNSLKWENFRIQVGFNAREGLVLHNIRFQDGATLRPIIYRMAIAEMLVPYADPRPPFHRKAVFDSGEYGMGFWANSLQPGVDCTSTAVFGHAAFNNLRGSGTTRQNVYCAYEDEPGLLFKHTNLRTRRVTYARNRRLIIASISTVGNYDYAFYWIFGLDGSIEFTVKATGVLDTELLAEREATFGYGIEIFPQVNTPFHQHHFAVRLDPMLDGAVNSVAVVDVIQDRGETGSKQNPYGQAFAPRRKQLETVAEGCTRIDPLRARTWEISTNEVHPTTKEKRAWRFVPMNTAPILIRRDSPLFPKAGFTNYDIWVTEYKDQELYPGGFYVDGKAGLPEIVKRNPHASLQGKDVVLWHIFGLTHMPRAEEFPIMPIEETGFILRPHNFFEQNPALQYGTSFTLPQAP